MPVAVKAAAGAPEGLPWPPTAAARHRGMSALGTLRRVIVNVSYCDTGTRNWHSSARRPAKMLPARMVRVSIS